MLESPLLQVALDLSRSLPRATRYSRLLAAIRALIPCDAVALFRLEQHTLIPVAVDGLPDDVLRQTFPVREHPRLDAILKARVPLRFPHNDQRPDPFDSWLADKAQGRVHACMGCVLRLENEVVGVLTLDAMRKGAFEKVSEELIENIVALSAASMQTAALLDALEQKAEKKQRVAAEIQRDSFDREGSRLIGQSLVVKKLKQEMDMVAASDLPVLILGETGTGKELVARILHLNSSRQDQVMVHVNCASLPESIAESELFGHVKGAFTGATQDRMGKFELADGGTLLLDEVGELPLSIQASLLRALQFGEIQRVGSDRIHRVNTRIIAATNRDLGTEVKDGRFRADLFHRLSVYPLQLPPLRDRKDDIPLLVKFFLGQLGPKLCGRPISISEEALHVLQNYDWPGNVRELEHCLTRAALRSSRRTDQASPEIEAEHLDGFFRQTKSIGETTESHFEPLQRVVEACQVQEIQRALRASNGNWALAAKKLGMHRSNLHRLALRLGLK